MTRTNDDRLATQRFTLRTALTAVCGRVLTPDLLDQLVNDMAIEIQTGATSWAFLPGDPATDVTKIMLDVVPGEDGMGLEIYAKSVDDVERAFTTMADRNEELEEQLAERTRSLNETVEYMNEGCICGRAPAPKHPVDPRLSKPAPKAKSEPETAELIPIVGRKDSGLTLHRIRRDAQGRITTAEVVNGLWTLKADHAKGEFWPAERPENRNRIDQYTGWTK